MMMMAGLGSVADDAFKWVAKSVGGKSFIVREVLEEGKLVSPLISHNNKAVVDFKALSDTGFMKNLGTEMKYSDAIKLAEKKAGMEDNIYNLIESNQKGGGFKGFSKDATEITNKRTMPILKERTPVLEVPATPVMPAPVVGELPTPVAPPATPIVPSSTGVVGTDEINALRIKMTAEGKLLPATTPAIANSTATSKPPIKEETTFSATNPLAPPTTKEANWFSKQWDAHPVLTSVGGVGAVGTTAAIGAGVAQASGPKAS